jgi:protein-L-isoaspartate(D-aspartate) O-methyltransferase
MSTFMSDFSARRVMMVDTQVRPSDVTKFPIIEAMLSVPREAYVPAALQEAAYMGGNLDLGGRVLLEARTLAKMLDALDVLPQDRVLDLAVGLGYSSAVIARMAKSVIGVEPLAALAAAAEQILTRQGVTNVLVQTSAPAGEFDVIVIQGGVQEVPEALLAQLAEGGRIAALFMQGPLGAVKIGHKTEGRVTWRFVFNATAPVLEDFAKAEAFVL